MVAMASYTKAAQQWATSARAWYLSIKMLPCRSKEKI